MIRRDIILGSAAALVLLGSKVRAKKASLKAHALIIANSYNGVGKQLALANTLADGRLIEQRLRDLRFVSVERVEDADEEVLRKRISDFRTSLGRQDFALLYIAGHGIQIDDENFLLLGDGNTYISLISLINMLRAATPMLVVMLDACRSRPFTNLPEGMRIARAIGKRTRSGEVLFESSDLGCSDILGIPLWPEF